MGRPDAFWGFCFSGVLRDCERSYGHGTRALRVGLKLCIRYPVSEMNVPQEISVAKPGSRQASEDSIDCDALVKAFEGCCTRDAR